MDKKFKGVADLTAGNNHTYARKCIAEMYPYLLQYKKRFEMIIALTEIEGSLPYLLSQYRDNVTFQMLHEIEKKEGFEIKNKIMECL